MSLLILCMCLFISWIDREISSLIAVTLKVTRWYETSMQLHAKSSKACLDSSHEHSYKFGPGQYPSLVISTVHDGVMMLEAFPHYWSFVTGFPHKGTLMRSFVCYNLVNASFVVTGQLVALHVVITSTCNTANDDKLASWQLLIFRSLYHPHHSWHMTNELCVDNF